MGRQCQGLCRRIKAVRFRSMGRVHYDVDVFDSVCGYRLTKKRAKDTCPCCQYPYRTRAIAKAKLEVAYARSR